MLKSALEVEKKILTKGQKFFWGQKFYKKKCQKPLWISKEKNFKFVKSSFEVRKISNKMLKRAFNFEKKIAAKDQKIFS